MFGQQTTSPMNVTYPQFGANKYKEQSMSFILNKPFRKKNLLNLCNLRCVKARLRLLCNKLSTVWPQLSGNSEIMEISSTLVQKPYPFPTSDSKLVLLGDLDSSSSEFILKNHLTLLFKRFVHSQGSTQVAAFKYRIRYVVKVEHKNCT